MSDFIVAYHGAKRWSGRPELKSAGKGKSEYGSGLYLTTSIDTARRYAKGGGRVMLFALDPSLTWLNDSKIPLDDSVAFVRSRKGLKNRSAIIDDLHVSAQRAGSDVIQAGALSNLMHYHGALTGAHGPALAEFYVSSGIDAELVNQSGEDWIVLFNMDKVEAYSFVDSRETRDLAPIKEQIEEEV